MVVSLVNCANLKKFPTNYVYEVDLLNNVCGEFKIVDPEQFLFEHVRDLPLSYCDGVFGFSTDKVGLVLDWSKAAIEKFNEKCK